MSKNGLILLTPTSIAYTGTSASISANGSVEFSACSVLSLNGVFSADYDNYMIVCRNTSTVNGSSCLTRFLSGGTPAQGATDYTYQYLYSTQSSVTGGRTTTSGFTTLPFGSGPNGDAMFIYGPYLAQPTAIRSVNIRYNVGTEIFDLTSTHNQSVSYDGITFIPQASALLSGRIAVYGMRK